MGRKRNSLFLLMHMHFWVQPGTKWFHLYSHNLYSIINNQNIKLCLPTFFSCWPFDGMKLVWYLFGIVLTVKHILIECADLLETRKKYFEIFVFTLSERDSGSGFWFLVWDWCVLQNMKCVKVMFVWSVLKELFKIFMWNVLKFVTWITRR